MYNYIYAYMYIHTYICTYRTIRDLWKYFLNFKISSKLSIDYFVYIFMYQVCLTGLSYIRCFMWQNYRLLNKSINS